MSDFGTFEPLRTSCFRRDRALRLLADAVIAATVLALLSGPVSAGLPERAGCPLRFDQSTTGLPRTCLFIGRFNTTRSAEVIAAFAGDGSRFVVALARGDATPLLFLPAAALSPTAGNLLRWREGVQPAAAVDGEAAEQVVGEVTLENGGRTLRVRAARRPGSDAPRAEFIGRFAGMADAGEDISVSQR